MPTETETVETLISLVHRGDWERVTDLVASECRARTDGLMDWLSVSDWDDDLTASDVAAAWDELNREEMEAGGVFTQDGSRATLCVGPSTELPSNNPDPDINNLSVGMIVYLALHAHGDDYPYYGLSLEPFRSNISKRPLHYGWLGNSYGVNSHALGAWEIVDIDGDLITMVEKPY